MRRRDMRTCVVLGVGGLKATETLPVYFILRGPLKGGRRHEPFFDAHESTIIATVEEDATPTDAWYRAMAEYYATSDAPAVPWQGGPPAKAGGGPK